MAANAQPARAASLGDGEAFHVWLTTATLEESAAALLPQPVPGLAGVSLVALTYCGPDGPSDGSETSTRPSSTGRFLAFLSATPKTGASSGGGRGPSAALDGRDCKAGVVVTAKRLSAVEGAPEGAVADVQAEVKSLAFHLTVRDAALVLAPGRKVPAGLEGWAPAGDAGKSAPAIKWSDVSLKNLPLDLTPERKLSVNATAGFLADGIDIVMGLADKRGFTQPSREAAARADTPAAANARFALGWDMTADVLRKLESPGPFLIETEQETFELSHLSLSGNGAGAKARGTVRARSVREDFQITVTFGDTDLKVTDVRVEPRLADCAALGFLQRVGCNSQNAARSAAAAAATSSLANRYQGQLLRKLLGTQVLKVDLGGLPIVLRAEPLSFLSTAGGIAGAALVKVEPLR